mgnify:CR=1 FL=1
MTLVQLEYVIALDNFRHFAIAAEKCFWTQPTLSMQIQKLEDSLGVIIFDRSKHPVEPTKIGEKIIKQARVVKAEAVKVGQLIEDEKLDVHGDIRIGVIPTVAPYLVPLFVSNFIEQYPQVNLQISEWTTDRLLEGLKRDEIDIGILATPLEEEGIKEIPLFYEQFQVYTSHRHELYEANVIDSTALGQDGLWILNEGHCFRTQMLEICNLNRSERFNNKVLYESGSLEALKKMVDKRGGYTLLPELFSLDLNKDDRSKLRSFSDPVPSREISLVTKISYAKAKTLEALHQEILRSLPPILLSQKNTEVVKFT